MKMYLLALSMLSFVSVVSSQEIENDQIDLNPNFDVELTHLENMRNSRPVFRAKLDSKPSVVRKYWKEFLAERYDCKIDNQEFILKVEAESMIDICNDSVVLYSVISEINSGSRLDVMLECGGRFIGEDSNWREENALKEMITDFMRTFYVNQYSDRINEQESVYRNLSLLYDLNIEVFELLETSFADRNCELENKIEEQANAENGIKDDEEIIRAAKQRIIDRQKLIRELNKDIIRMEDEISIAKEEIDNASMDSRKKKEAVEEKLDEIASMKLMLIFIEQVCQKL